MVLVCNSIVNYPILGRPAKHKFEKRRECRLDKFGVHREQQRDTRIVYSI